ncbi:MAG: hypothetical protein LBI90_06615 [Treponema sp.]|jgi:hypothetical protein|nr:hypothetical protein [Treponema sp.]
MEYMQGTTGLGKGSMAKRGLDYAGMMNATAVNQLADNSDFTSNYLSVISVLGTEAALANIGFSFTSYGAIAKILANTYTLSSFMSFGGALPANLNNGNYGDIALGIGGSFLGHAVDKYGAAATAIYLPISMGRQVPSWAPAAVSAAPQLTGLAYSSFLPGYKPPVNNGSYKHNISDFYTGEKYFKPAYRK